MSKSSSTLSNVLAEANKVTWLEYFQLALKGSASSKLISDRVVSNACKIATDVVIELDKRGYL